MPRAVILLSGGLDSTTTLAVAKEAGFECFALSVDYGQRHRIELERANSLVKSMGVSDHRTVTLDLRAIGGSALTDNVAVPKDRSEGEMETGIPVTYVPARNTILLGLALGFRASLRQAPGPGLNSSNAASDDATNARPLVEFAPPVAPPPAAEPGKTDAEKVQEAAAQSAAQAVQAKPSKPNGSIDEILASPTEKPPAPVKPGADEAPPPANQSDVPF